jgi:hypothetical protein
MHSLFFAPDCIETELPGHRSYLVKKAKISEIDLDILMHTLLDKITLVPFEDFKTRLLSCDVDHGNDR